MSNSALLGKVDKCLHSVRRQQDQVRMLKSGITGAFLSAFIIALYIATWPNAGDKLSSVYSPQAGTFLFSIIILISLIACLWLMLGIVLSFVSYLYFRHKDNKLIVKSTDKALTSRNFLLHLNRLHPSLEESAHFLAFSETALSSVQAMQLQRITASLSHLINSPEQSWLPQAPFRHLISKGIVLIFASLLVLTIVIKYSIVGMYDVSSDRNPENLQALTAPTSYMNNIKILVSPPEYTQQASYEQSDFNISALQGSKIEWRLPLGQKAVVDGSFELRLSDKQTLPFVRNALGYSVSLTASASAVYTISQRSSSENFMSDIATISVKQDTAPRITFKNPILTITEINKSAASLVATAVEIKDDYGITDVKIVASIAKGSGESVKFRDQAFLFDDIKQDITPVKQTSGLYSKNWDLHALKMEPGDELYFSVHASDNKTPTSQKTVSPIKIIRWLEDEEASLSADGIVIDFMPEYFKSQAQIIIETEALIEQSQSLSYAQISAVSRALAIDQSDLKQSYGQYLGDEFESGIMHNMEAGPTVSSSTSQSNENEHSENEQVEQSHEHESQGEHKPSSTDLSGYQDVIEQFGHNHGEANIGFIKTFQGQINPKVLMKSAIAAMWQAELHLQLSEPSLALPYENEALKFLNRAKQAERIYVKRLGFEPPPVSEERRYAGKLKDILSYKRDTVTLLDPSENIDYIELIVLLNRHLTLAESALGTPNPLHPHQRELIETVSRRLSKKLANEPEWIAQLATLQRIQIANSFNINDCAKCLTSLLKELSSQILPSVAKPYLQQKMYSTNHPSVKAYAKSLLTERKGDETETTQEGKP